MPWNIMTQDFKRSPSVSQLNKCQKFMAFWGIILYRIQSFLSPRADLNFRHLFSCDTIVSIRLLDII